MALNETDMTTFPTTGTNANTPSPVAFEHGATGEKFYTEADLARIRQEEKNKLYPEISSLKEQFATTNASLKALQEQRDAELAEVARKVAEKDAEILAKKEAEMSAKALLETKLKETNDTWEQRFAQLEQAREAERAQLAKEREYNDLQDYRVSRLNAEKENIDPRFHPFISGDTKDEIEAKINQAKAATQEIFAEVATEMQRQVPRGISPSGVSPTGYTVMGPESQQKVYTAEDINRMTMKEYEKFRNDIGLSQQQAQSSRGILG